MPTDADTMTAVLEALRNNDNTLHPRSGAVLAAIGRVLAARRSGKSPPPAMDAASIARRGRRFPDATRMSDPVAYDSARRQQRAEPVVSRAALFPNSSRLAG